MNYLHKEIEFPSSDGKNKIHAELFVPSFADVKGVLQISHGMKDYIGRYSVLADAITAAGYVVAGNDHLGHGTTVATPDDYGYFAEKGGYEYVIDDVNRMNAFLHSAYPNVPIILLGHSMGSFVARLYAEKYPESIDALIIHGTAGPNPILPLGKCLIKILKLLRGDRHRSKFVYTMAEGGYNKAFDKSEGKGAWLTRDASTVADRIGNPKTEFIFTLSAYADLFEMLGACNEDAWFEKFPKKLPTLVMSGDADPVGDFGKGVSYVYNKLRVSGAEVELKTYEGARHELFNETNREEVFADLVKWLDGIRKVTL
jgi:alpha-beta hydrolase superfamily lysophospholipase